MASKQSNIRGVLSSFNIEVTSRSDEHNVSSSDGDISDDSLYTDSDVDYCEEEEDEEFFKACCVLDDRLLLYFQHLYANNSKRRAMAAKNANALVAEEEREKRKTEKRKAKKKKRREKRKEGKDHTTSDKGGNTSDKQETSEKQRTENSQAGSDIPSFSSIEDDGEEFLDVNSAFVSVAVSKNKRNTIAATNTTTGMEKGRLISRKSQVSTGQVTAESERLAVIGFKLASKEQYEQAVEFFTKAIRLVHDDHRFFSNRSFCHCQLGNYSKALKDADKAIDLSPSNPKGYYRRGEALKGLDQFKEAEEAFERVIELDEECEDAVQELKFVKLQQLLEMGYPEQKSIIALQRFNSVQAALNALAIQVPENYINNHGREDSANIFLSDQENLASISPFHHTEEIGNQPNQPILKASKMDPSNPEGHLSLWVGNVSQEVTETQLIDLFSKFGIVLSVRLLPEKYCAFINFRDKTSPGPAMKCLQNRELGGERLLIRYPNNRVPETQQHIIVKKTLKSPVTGIVQAKVTGPVNGDECHFWRTTGCVFGSKCRYKHLKENKGMDKKPWQKAS